MGQSCSEADLEGVESLKMMAHKPQKSRRKRLWRLMNQRLVVAVMAATFYGVVFGRPG